MRLRGISGHKRSQGPARPNSNQSLVVIASDCAGSSFFHSHGTLPHRRRHGWTFAHLGAGTGASKMTELNAQNRLGDVLRRLRTAPRWLRAIATADAAAWPEPDFETSGLQRPAITTLVRSSRDARAAAVGARARGARPSRGDAG